MAQDAKDVARAFTPVNSDNYRPRLALALPEYGIPYLVEADLFIHSHHKRHTHRDLQVLAFTDGQAAMEIGPETFDLPAGTILVLWPGVPHRVVRRGDHTRATVLDVRLTVEADGPVGPLVQYLQGLGGGPAFACEPRRLRDAVGVVRDAARAQPLQAQAAGLSTDGRSTARLMAAVWGLLAELNSADTTPADPPDAGPAVDRRLSQAEQYMRERLAQPLGVAGVAEAVGLSRSQLTRLFLAHVGVSPAARLRQLRVERAAQLLRDTTLAIKEIARVCGFANPNHFSRVYQEVTGRTPSAERK